MTTIRTPLTRTITTARRPLRTARERSERYAGDMAKMVAGLSDGAVVELAEA